MHDHQLMVGLGGEIIVDAVFHSNGVGVCFRIPSGPSRRRGSRIEVLFLLLPPRVESDVTVETSLVGASLVGASLVGQYHQTPSVN